MSNCGKCKNKSCACFLIGDGTTTIVKGIGTAYSPYQVRPKNPTDYRPTLYLSRSNAQAITLNTNTAIAFDRSRVSLNVVITSTTKLTIPTSGLYLIGGFAAIDGVALSQIWNVWIAKNGVVGVPLVKRTATASVGTVGVPLYASLMTLVRLTANDYLELYVNSNRSLNAFGTFDPLPNLWASWMGA